VLAQEPEEAMEFRRRCTRSIPQSHPKQKRQKPNSVRPSLDSGLSIHFQDRSRLMDAQLTKLFRRAQP
jgi:hypothetical protein